jgi:hypothetical protein
VEAPEPEEWQIDTVTHAVGDFDAVGVECTRLAVTWTEFRASQVE